LGIPVRSRPDEIRSVPVWVSTMSLLVSTKPSSVIRPVPILIVVTTNAIVVTEWLLATMMTIATPEFAAITCRTANSHLS
jgi:hypothetical protein